MNLEVFCAGDEGYEPAAKRNSVVKITFQSDFCRTGSRQHFPFEEINSGFVTAYTCSQRLHCSHVAYAVHGVFIVAA